MAVRREVNNGTRMYTPIPPSQSLLLKPKGVLKLSYISTVFLQDNIIFSDAVPYPLSHISPLLHDKCTNDN